MGGLTQVAPGMQGERSFRISPEELDRKELWFCMGYGSDEPDGNIRTLVEELIARLVPKANIRYIYRILEAEKISPRQMVVDGVTFSPQGIICSYLKGMTHACMYIATVGREFDAEVKELNKEGDIFKDFIADSIGTALAEFAVSQLEKDLTELAHGPKGNGLLQEGLRKGGISMSYSPGYCGWDIREQRIFFSLFPDEPCGVRLTDSCLMQPEKSVSGFFAMGEELVRQPYHCAICKNVHCYKRRTK